MAIVQETGKIWMNGKFVPWKDAKVHVLTHTLHYGSGAFEGIRAYKTDKGTAIFRLHEHVDRLFNSASAINMKIPYTKKEIFDAIVQTVKVNKVSSCYIRPICFFGYGQVGLDTTQCNVEVAIICFPFGAYLGEEALKKGIKVTITKNFKRYYGPLNKAKIDGNYYHSSLAKVEGKKLGFDETIMMDDRNFVSEATGENLFIIEDDALITPREGSILLGITRDSVMTLAKDLKLSVREQDITKDDLLNADEAFLTGTAAEVTPINSVDGKKLKRIDIALKLQKLYFDTVMGKNKKYEKWLTVV
jgi:branched-chain amino acid aminotransferase